VALIVVWHTFAENPVSMKFLLFDPVSFLEIAGTFVFAISGVSTAYEKRFDLMGVIIIAFVTAIGGGTLRDIMIGVQPVSWLTDLNIIATIGVSVVLSFFFLDRILKLRRTLFLFDTIGLGLFTVHGLERTLAAGLSPVVAVMMGTITAVFGGVLRDLLSNNVPLIFGGTIYATNAVAGGILYIATLHFNVSQSIAMPITVAFVITMRSLAVRYSWSLPSIR
jgi:uncharacterized membrane protein YeiH